MSTSHDDTSGPRLSPAGTDRRETILKDLLREQSRRRRRRHVGSYLLAAILGVCALFPALTFTTSAGRGTTPYHHADSSPVAVPTNLNWSGIEIVTNKPLGNAIGRIGTKCGSITIVSTADLIETIHCARMTDEQLLAELRLMGRSCGLARVAGGPAQLLCDNRGAGG